MASIYRVDGVVIIMELWLGVHITITSDGVDKIFMDKKVLRHF